MLGLVALVGEEAAIQVSQVALGLPYLGNCTFCYEISVCLFE
jgi:hypothetical protein